jgi:hypothetical protein
MCIISDRTFDGGREDATMNGLEDPPGGKTASLNLYTPIDQDLTA